MKNARGARLLAHTVFIVVAVTLLSSCLSAAGAPKAQGASCTSDAECAEEMCGALPSCIQGHCESVDDAPFARVIPCPDGGVALDAGQSE